jgi:hypothetical protein
MKRLAFFFTLAIPGAAQAAEPLTAVEACKALPKAQHKAIARIAGRGGKPLPDSWIIVVHDPIAQNGLKEYTVTAGTVVATRGISDLAQRLTPGDVIGLDGIKFDATQVAELAASYADANQLTPAWLNYELKKEGEEAAPLWKITAVDSAGMSIGDLVVTANTGALITQNGFAKVPALKDLAAVAEAEPADEDPEEKPQKGSTRSSTKGSNSSTSSKKRPDTFHRIGGHLQKFFTGKNTIGR